MTHKGSTSSFQLILAAVALVTAPAFAQGPFSSGNAGVPYDWSHHHLVYSAPTTRDQTNAVEANPRYWQQWTYRNMPHNLLSGSQQDSDAVTPSAVSAALPIGGGNSQTNNVISFGNNNNNKKKANGGIWQMGMGSGASVGAGNYPAKYSFVTTSAFCNTATQPDFVVYNTGLAGAAGQASIVAFDNLYTGCNIARTGLHPSSSVTSGTNTITFAAGTVSAADIGSLIVDATLSTRIATNTIIVAVNTNTITISNVTASTIPTTDSLTITPPVPNVYWSYNTSKTSTDVISSSVSLSADGKQVLFINSNASGSSLNVLRWVAGEGVPSSSTATNVASAPKSPTTQTLTGAAYTACLATATSCQLTLAFATPVANVTNSAAYYDYGTDAAYVGDDNGVLHKFVNVFGIFGGTASEVKINNGGCGATCNWPLTVSTQTSKILTIPVEDSVTHKIFVGDFTGKLYLITETSTIAAAVTTSTAALVGPLTDGPIVDGSSGSVFAFPGSNGDSGMTVYQFNESLTQLATTVMPGGGAFNIVGRIGTFDNNYFANGVNVGHLYACGPNDNTSTNHAGLWNLTFSAGKLTGTKGNTPIELVNHSNDSTTLDECSPMTEFLNGTVDRLFFSVPANGNDLSGQATCTGVAASACLYMFAIGTNTTASYPTGTHPAGAELVTPGGTSGIVVDNAATGTTGAQQIYFTPLTNVATCPGSTLAVNTTGKSASGCATQVTQSALN